MGRSLAIVLAAIALLAACTTNPIPEGYTGPRARIADSMTGRSVHSVDFFYLSAIDGRSVDNNLSATQTANYGRGFQMTPSAYGRDVPARPSTYTIVGRTHYAAPILELLNRVYEVSGDVNFTPVPDRSYVVKGVLGDDYSAVWIEEVRTGQLVTKKIEVKGSAALGILAK